MGGRDEPRLTEAELVELGGGDIGKAFGLVDDEDHLAAGLAQANSDALVVRSEAGTGVADEDDDVGLVDRKLGLAGHGLDDAFGLDGLEAARVDDDVGHAADTALTVLTVAGKPGESVDLPTFGRPTRAMTGSMFLEKERPDDAPEEHRPAWIQGVLKSAGARRHSPSDS